MDIPFFEVQFDKQGNIFQPSQESDIIRYLTTAPGNQTTDVVTISHGWNNDMDEARTLYRNFFKNLAALIPASSGRQIAAIGILWPSKKFAEKDLIPSGAAAFNPYDSLSPLLKAQLDGLKNLFGDAAADELVEQLGTLLPNLENSAEGQRTFVQTLGTLLRPHLDNTQTSFEEGSPDLEQRDGAQVLQDLGHPMVAAPPVNFGGGGAADIGGLSAAAPATAGPAASLQDFMDSITAGASRLMNLATYYVMKDRAGVVARNGVNPMLSRIQAAVPASMRFHLAGHSFGGRLVTATVDGPNRLRVNTLLLLQAAFSHNGFATQYDGTHDGFFTRVLKDNKVSGPILITHSDKDMAVGMAYPLASRINGDTAAALGDANDIYGGMGRNGAQHMGALAEDLTLLPASTPYQFSSACPIHNLNGDGVITGHGDVARAETAWALAVSILS